MGTVLKFQTSLETYDCGKCGGTYAINEKRADWHRENGGGWNCPYCQCSWGYYGDTPAQKLQKELDAERARKNAALARENEQRQRAEAAEKKLKRTHNGVCPCCNRTFQNLARHMKTKHPDAK